MIYLDYDSNLVDLVTPWLESIEMQYGEKIKKSDISGFDYLAKRYGEDANLFWSQSGVYNNIFPIDGAVAFVDNLKKLVGKNNLFILTVTPHDNKMEKTEHAKKYFGIESSNVIHVATDKFPYCRNGVLMDDYPVNVAKHVYQNKRPGIIFNHNGNNGWCDITNYSFENVCASSLLDTGLVYHCTEYVEAFCCLEEIVKKSDD